MKPAKRTDAELLEWAKRLVERAQKDKIYGVVTIHLEHGTIVRAQTQRNEVPCDEFHCKQ